MRAPIAAAALALLLAAPPAPHGPRVAHVPERAPGPDSAPVRNLGDERLIGANDLARLLDATKFWRGDVRKLELRVHSHRVLLTADNPYVIVDESTVRLPSPVRSLGGELHAPIALIDSLPGDSTVNRLAYDPRGDQVVVLPPGGMVGTPRLVVGEGVTRLVIPADRPQDAAVVARARAHFRLRFAGYFAGVLPDSTRQRPLTGIHLLPAVSGTVLELALSSEAQGFRLVRDVAAKKVTLEFSRVAGEAWESFAPEGPPGPRALRIVVLDPGHGGADAGVTAEGVVEKSLALELAKRLKGEIEHRLHARVFLTREDDRTLDVQQRAEAANRARADVVLSLHFDGGPGTPDGGASALCAPADVGSTAGELGGMGPGAIVMLPWRDVASRHAVESRALAEAVLSSLELRGMGPTHLIERLPYPLLGVNAPGLLLECATLDSPRDRERVTHDDGLTALARAIVDGLDAYRRND